VAKSRGRGRKQKTTAIVPSSQPTTITVPEYVPAETRDLYIVAVDAIARRGATQEDMEAIVEMCQAAAYVRRAAADIESNGMVIDTPFGPKVNPMLKVHKEQSARYMSIANEYGLTLASRLRLGLMQIAGESMLSGLHADLGLRVDV
jgi:P27 family predicted phage terminase small subunit